MADKTLLLVDGHSLAYRAYFALPPELASPSGELTNASYGFTSMLLTVLESEKPDYVVVAFDKGPSFRVKTYSDYKAHREKMPQEMRDQMSRIQEMVRAFGFPIIELPDYEADDVLGTLSKQAAEQDLKVVIVTGDRDALQLVDDKVTVLTSGRRFSDTIYYTPEKVQERYQLTPNQLIDLKALVGDKSDNIPGVRGVGDKGATTMLLKYETLDGVYAHVDEMTTRYQNALNKGKDYAYLSYDLGRIRRDAPVQLDLANAEIGEGFDRAQVTTLMQNLGFTSLLTRLKVMDGAKSPLRADGQLSLFGDDAVEPDVIPQHGDYHLVDSVDALKSLCKQLSLATRLAFDTETTGIDVMIADLVGISITDSVGKAWYIPVKAPASDKVIALDDVFESLNPIMANPSIEKMGHNLKYDIKMLKRYGYDVAGTMFDTMIAEWLLNPNARVGLKNQAWIRLGVQMTEISELIGTGRKQITMDQVSVDKVMPYACADADMTFRLAEQLRPELEVHKQSEMFSQMEMALLPVLIEMELNGIKVDTAWLKTLSRELTERLGALHQTIIDAAGMPFNLNSTQQLSTVLFDRLGLPTRGIRKNKSGHYSTRAAVLEGLRGKHAIVDAILEYRELTKLKSTYVDALPDLVVPETGRIHTTYNQTGAVTGRLSSVNPNLQNIPIRTEEGRRVRRAFIPEDGWMLMGADYSQVELRVMAHVSNDPGLIGAFERDEDVHATTAAAVYDVPLAEVTKDQRRIAKAVNFGLMYGQSAFGLARQLGISVDDAQTFITRYFERFKAVKVYMQQVQDAARDQGYVETLLKRRRYFSEFAPGSVASSNDRQSALRMAVNTPIQGSAADILKLAMIRMPVALKEAKLKARMLLQVHDEVVLEVPQDELDATAIVVRDVMANAFDLRVPLKVDVEIGPNWEELSLWSPKDHA